MGVSKTEGAGGNQFNLINKDNKAKTTTPQIYLTDLAENVISSQEDLSNPLQTLEQREKYLSKNVKNLHARGHEEVADKINQKALESVFVEPHKENPKASAAKSEVQSLVEENKDQLNKNLKASNREKQIAELEQKKTELEQEYHQVSDALRTLKRTHANLLEFIEELKNDKITPHKKQQILDNIINICKEQIPTARDRDTTHLLMLIQHYAEREASEALFVKTQGANRPQISSINPEEKNKALVDNFMGAIRKAVEETKGTRQRNKLTLEELKELEKEVEGLLKKIDSKDSSLKSKVSKTEKHDIKLEIEEHRKELMEKIIDFCGELDDYIPKDKYDRLMSDLSGTKVRLLEIRPKLGEIERTSLTPQESACKKAQAFCELLAKVQSEAARGHEDQLDTLANELSNTKKKLGEDGAVILAQHQSEKSWIDPKMQQILAGRFSSYVSTEIEQGKSSEAINQLMTLGKKAELPKLKKKLSVDNLKQIKNMNRYASRKVEKIPLEEPKKTIESLFKFKHPNGKETTCEVNISKTPTGNWNVELNNKGKKGVHSFRSYMEAASWVHAELDKQYMTHTGDHQELLELIQASRILQTWQESAKGYFEKIGAGLDKRVNPGGTSAAAVGALPLDNLAILSNVSDIINLSLLLPSIFLAVEASESREQREVIEVEIKEDTKTLNDNTKELEKLLSKYPELKKNAPDFSATKKRDTAKFSEEVIKQQDQMSSKIENLNKEKLKLKKQIDSLLDTIEVLESKGESSKKDIRKLDDKVDALEDDLDKIRGQIKKLRKQSSDLDSIVNLTEHNHKLKLKVKNNEEECRKLHLEEVEKATAATTSIIGLITSFSNTVLALDNLRHLGSLSLDASQGTSHAVVTAAMSLSIISGVCNIVGGGVQLGIDSYRVHENRVAKEDLKKIFKEIKADGQDVLNQNDIQLMDRVRKMQTRSMNNAIASSSIGIGSDLTMVVSGAVGVAGVAGVACPPLLVVIPVAAAVALGAKLASNKIVQEVSDKKQEALLITNPLNSDIGLIYSLRKRIQQNDDGAKLITSKLIEGFYQMTKQDFLTMTATLDERYAELEIMHQRTQSTTKKSVTFQP